MNYYQVKLIKNLLEHKTLISLLTFLWTAVVAYLCIVNADGLPSMGFFEYDKAGHLAFHFGITVMWFLFWKTNYNNSNKIAMIKAFFFSLIFGICIEIIQGFSETRSADIQDVYANIGGSLIGLIFVFILIKLESKFQLL